MGITTHRVIVHPTEDRDWNEIVQECTAWLDERGNDLERSAFFTSSTRNYDVLPYTFAVHFLFSHPDDAMLFKLTWGGR